MNWQTRCRIVFFCLGCSERRVTISKREYASIKSNFLDIFNDSFFATQWHRNFQRFMTIGNTFFLISFRRWLLILKLCSEILNVPPWKWTFLIKHPQNLLYFILINLSTFPDNTIPSFQESTLKLIWTTSWQLLLL